MSTDESGEDGSPTPGVPEVGVGDEIEDPRPSTPLTETFRTGTASDPPRPERAADPDGEAVTLTVDGETVVVPPDATLLDAAEAAGREVPALCHYDRDTEAGEEIGPRTTCRTCVVETEREGLVAACSTPATDGAEIETGTADAEEARETNLELVLSDHNLRCTTCGKNGRCELQDASIEAGITHPEYGVADDRGSYEPLDPTAAIHIDRNKCILCNRCVEACNDVQVEGVLRVEGSGGETRIGFQSDAETMADSACVSCGHCATVCPTGSLVEGGLADATTLPLPGFTQRNSVGSELESERDRARAGSREPADDPPGVAGFMKRAKRSVGSTARDVGSRALKAGEHVAEDVAAGVFSEGILFGIAKRVGDARLDRLDRTETTCGYCAVGCRFELYSDDERVLGVRPTDPDAAPANDFSTCVKGKFGYGFVERDDRLETPLIRDGDGFREASWAEALDRVADELGGIRDEYGPDAISCFASSKCTNEEDYLMQKFARAVIGTKNIDNCARLCHSSTVAALLGTVGYGAMSNSIDDVANADCYLFSGTNTTESHPVLATKVKRNVRDGAELVVVDPRKVDIAEHADQYLRSNPGYDIAWLNGMARHIIAEDLHDEAFIESNVRDFEALAEKVEPFTPEAVEELAGIDADELTEAAERIATADSVVFGWAMGLTQHAHGTNNVRAMANLALLTGNVGKPNAGLSPFRGHNNVQGGGGDMGTLPNTLPGYQDVTDESVLDTFEAAWGVRPPGEVGLKVPETFQAIHDGDVRGLYVMGENPALSEPDIGHAEEALEAVDFLVVQDLFMTETAEHADVVLPAAAFAEKSGTFTNTERRVQRVRKALDPPGEARQDWAILQSLANRIDHGGPRWDYAGPTEIFDELTDLTPIYGGLTHDRIEREGGIQWPCPDADHPGTKFLYEDGFNFPDGKARFVPADMGEPGELPDETYPLTLTTGRMLYHFHTGTLTRRVEEITDHAPESFVEIHPETAAGLGVEDGETVRVESERGHIDVRAAVSDRPGKGVVFVPMHFADGAVNTLTGERYDPTSGIPEYKVASVRITPIEEGGPGSKAR